MTESRTDDRISRSWGGRPHGPSSGGQYVASKPVVPVPNRGAKETHTVAGVTQGTHKPDVIFVVKRDSMVLRISHLDHGTPGDGEVGRSILGFFAQEHSEDITRAFESAFASGEPQSFVCRGNPPLAVGAWYHCLVSPDHGEPRVESATLFAQDITKWKHTEDQFRAEVETLRSKIVGLSSANAELTDLAAGQDQCDGELRQFREIMNHAGEAIFIADAHTDRFVDVNDTACRWLGISREELLQMCVGDLDLEFPLKSSDHVFDHVTDTRDTNRPIAFVRGSHRRKNGSSFPVEVALSHRRFGNRDFLLAVARDVNQRLRWNQTFLDDEKERRGLFAISRDAGYCSARDGTVCDVNDSALELFGYTRREFLKLEARRLYRHPEHVRAFQRAVEEKGSVKNFPAEFQTKTGKSFHGFLGATMRYDSDGNVQGYQCIVSPKIEIAALESNAERVTRDIEEARSESAAARADAEQSVSQAAKAKLDAAEATSRADALEKDAERAKKEIEEAKSQTATAQAEVKQVMSQVAKEKLETAEATNRADALEKDAERAKKEIDEANSQAAKAQAEVKQVTSQVAKAKLDAEEATSRADALEKDAERAKKEIEEAKSQTATARMDAEHGMTEVAIAKLNAEKAKKRADALEREAERANSETRDAKSETAEIKLRVEESTERAARAEEEADAALLEVEKAKQELASAKLDTERARSETATALEDVEQAISQAAKAKLDAEEAKELVQQLKCEAETSVSDTRKAVLEAANAWAELERAEREILTTRSALSEPEEIVTGSGALVHVRGGGGTLLAPPVLRRRRRKEPLTQPPATHWSQVFRRIVRRRIPSRWWRRAPRK